MNETIRNLKKKYIPMRCAGKITIAQCASLIGITPRSVCRLQKRYKVSGISCFNNGNKGHVAHNKKNDESKIISLYNKHFSYAPFAIFCDTMNDTDTLRVSYSHVSRVLRNAGFVSPRARLPVREKRKHLPRKERPCEGDLVQMDGSPYDWLMNGTKCTMHGAIDDATHKIVAMYLCKNECRLGYNELLMQMHERTGGFPRAVYTDRATALFKAKDAVGKVSIQEQLAGIRDNPTQWQSVCASLNIDCIIALSPQAKGRIERLWETLQGRLPYIFRFYGIDTIEKANDFLIEYIDGFNKHFSVPAQSTDLHWHTQKALIDYDFLFSVRTEKSTKYDGSFIYHGNKFAVVAPFVACKKFTLCLSERFGLRAYMNGKYYPVELKEPMCSVVGDRMPEVEQELVYRYLLADIHSGVAAV